MIESLESASILFHWSPPVAIGPRPRLFLMTPGSKPDEVSLSQLAAHEGPIVTHSFALLIEWFREARLPHWPEVIDIEICLKLLAGTRKRGAPTSLRAFLGERLAQDPDLEILCNQHALPRTSEEALVREQGLRMAELCGAAWPELIETLVRKQEAQRFVKIEVPIYNLMLRVQADGILIDCQTCKEFIELIESEYESLVYQLSIAQGISIERAYADPAYLTKVARLPPEAEVQSCDRLLEQWSDLSRECTDLRQVQRLRMNRDVLIRAVGSGFPRCYVTFDTMGTVTGRILAVDPHLQNLKRRFRAILQPDPDHRWAYYDYRQFEPRIMASLSGDADLRELCASDDLYSRIANGFENVGVGRDQAKKVYLAYSYGMNTRNMIALVSGIVPDAPGVAANVVSRLQRILAGVESWKSGVWRSLEVEGRIGTALGNYRYRSGAGDLSESEKRWSVSQVIQGTGSLILKRLSILIDRLGAGLRIALPMHDALLLQVPVDVDCSELDAELRLQSRRAAGEFCPGVEIEAERRAFIRM